MLGEWMVLLRRQLYGSFVCVYGAVIVSHVPHYDVEVFKELGEVFARGVLAHPPNGQVLRKGGYLAFFLVSTILALKACSVKFPIFGSVAICPQHVLQMLMSMSSK